MKTPEHWQKRGALAWGLWPVSALFGLLAAIRRLAFRQGLLRSSHPGVPVVVIGNITAGGSGKTPLVIALVKLLRQNGLRPGVVSRGYGGHQSDAAAQLVTAESDPFNVGDEPVLIAQRTGCPVAVCSRRFEAAQLLCDRGDVDVLLTDDGLQHYALRRDIEIAVVDANAHFGNQFLLPAGPLREPTWRLETVDFVVVNGDEAGFDLMATGVYPLADPEALQSPLELAGREFHAVAGIARPERFFESLKLLGLSITPHVFSDHHRYAPADLSFDTPGEIIMTEKDAVKCGRFQSTGAWALRVEAVLARDWSDALLRRVTELVAHYRGHAHG